MGEKVRRVESKVSNSGSVAINLFGPGMTSLHKVGLAGLWMTLKALEADEAAMRRLRKTGGSWERQDTSVALRWEKEPEPFFEQLFKESFKIDKNGLLWFPALGEPTSHPQHAVVLQEAVLGSFLQHGRTRNADKAQEPRGNISVELDEARLVLRFRRLTWYVHQDSKFSTASVNSLAGWHFPGGAVRHVGLGQESTALQDPPERALALRYAPVGAIYFELRHRGGGVKPQYALALPEIRNLDRYARARASFLKFGAKQLYASGTAEAGLRVLSELHAAGMLQDIGSAFCRVISFGVVPWAKQQKTRVEMFTVQVGSESALRTFALCRQFFESRLIRPQEGNPFWDVPQVPDLVARNLSEGHQWWDGFRDFVADQERRDHIFGYVRDKKTNRIVMIVPGEKGGLAKMVESEQALPQGPERMFVMACHEAWRRRMGQLGQRARRERASFPDLVNREFERLRVTFSRCKNAVSLREAVTDFWARAGSPLSPLQMSWDQVLPLLDEKNWRKGKDLALLSLASYKPVTKDEEEAFTSSAMVDAKGGK